MGTTRPLFTEPGPATCWGTQWGKHSPDPEPDGIQHKGPPIPLTQPLCLYLIQMGKQLETVDVKDRGGKETSFHAGHRTEQKDILLSLKLVQAEQ